jgi:hypothetical protein
MDALEAMGIRELRNLICEDFGMTTEGCLTIADLRERALELLRSNVDDGDDDGDYWDDDDEEEEEEDFDRAYPPIFLEWRERVGVYDPFRAGRGKSEPKERPPRAVALQIQNELKAAYKSGALEVSDVGSYNLSIADDDTVDIESTELESSKQTATELAHESP